MQTSSSELWDSKCVTVHADYLPTLIIFSFGSRKHYTILLKHEGPDDRIQ